MEKLKHKPEHALMQAIGFSAEDLEANQEGRLSDRQRNRFDPLRITWNRLKNIARIIAAVALIFLLLQMLDPQIDKPSLSTLIVMAATVLGYAVYYATDKWAQYRMDLVRNRAGSIEGRVSIDIVQDRQKLVYKVTIDHMRFIISKETFLSFKNGDPYVIYFAPYSKTLLSAEWLRD